MRMEKAKNNGILTLFHSFYISYWLGSRQNSRLQNNFLPYHTRQETIESMIKRSASTGIYGPNRAEQGITAVVDIRLIGLATLRLVVATHRVVRIDAASKHFYTKGDANQIEDGDPVHFNNVIGVPQFSIPKLGYVADFVQNPPGMYVTIVLGAALLLIVFVPDMVKKKKKPQDPEQSGDGAAQS